MEKLNLYFITGFIIALFSLTFVFAYIDKNNTNNESNVKQVTYIDDTRHCEYKIDKFGNIKYSKCIAEKYR